MTDAHDRNGKTAGGTLLWAAAGLVVMAALMRIVVHPWNFAPIGAMALFGGAALRRPVFAFAVPLAAMAASDLLLGFMGRTQTMLGWVYAAFVLIGLLGFALRRSHSPVRVAAASVGGSVLFYLVTNFGVWAGGWVGYPMTLGGLMASYTAAIPFFWNTLGGDLVWNAVLFGTLALISRRLPVPSGAHAA